MNRFNGNGRPQGQAPKAENNGSEGGGRTPPFATLQIGVLKAFMWKNVSDKGNWYSVDFS